ncbi:MAG: hypothetical protein IPQ09_06955 [Myxococcales bacterium]|nr:hypothetical protein [Myxococcales bacterium]
MSCLPARRCASVPRVRRRSLRATKRAWASLAAVCVGLHPSAARAADAEVHASSVTFDAGRGELLLEGDVRVDSPPFHLRSHRVSLRRVGGGPLDVKGEGTLAFCPCLGAPLSVTFQGAKVAPPADLFLERPTLALYGLPVLWLPAFWLRAPSRPGLPPPVLAYRGSDGLYGGLGGHLPWHRASGEIGALDLRLGGYTRGGGVVDARLLSPTSQTHVRVDHLTRTGLSVDARGFGAGALAPVSWDLDLLRGDRALVATTRLDDAARPWDRASIEATWAPGWGRVTGGAESALPRGGSIDSLGATGPVVGFGARGVSAGGAAQGWIDAAARSLSTTGEASGVVHVARARGGAELVGTLGAIAGKVGATAEATGTHGPGLGPQRDSLGLLAALVRARAGVPLARRFGDRNGGLVHTVEPLVTAAAGGLSGRPALGITPLSGDVPEARSAAVAAGVRTALGPVASRSALSLELTAGALTARDRPTAGAQGRLAARSRWAAASAQGGWLAGDATGLPSAAFAEARARVGPEDGVRVQGRVVYGSTVDATGAARLADGGADTPGPWLTSAGTSVGGRGTVPVARRVSVSGGADGAVLTSRSPTLLGAFGALELRDACQCLLVRAVGSGRLGRPGVDVWLSLEVLTDRGAPPK